MEDIEFILLNAPDKTTSAEVIQALEKAEGDVTEAIASLWKLPPKVETPKKDADKMRELFDEFDTAMHKTFMKPTPKKNPLLYKYSAEN